MLGKKPNPRNLLKGEKSINMSFAELLPIGLFFQRTECVLWSVNMTHGPLGYSAGGKYYKENKITKVLTHLQMYNVESEIWIWIQIVVVVAVFPPWKLLYCQMWCLKYFLYQLSIHFTKHFNYSSHGLPMFVLTI